MITSVHLQTTMPSIIHNLILLLMMIMISTAADSVKMKPQKIKIDPTTTSYKRTIGTSLNSVTCSAVCEPSCNFKWIFPDGTTGTSNVLSLSRIEKNHDGNFKCKVTNAIGSAETSFSLDVQYPPENVTLSPSNTSYSINEKDAISIICLADCNPICRYQWVGPGGMLNDDMILQLTSTSRYEDGQYRCRVENKLGSKYSQMIRIDFYHSPTDITLSPSTYRYTKLKGESLGPITCTADCKPSCQYQWKFPDKSLQPTRNLFIYSLSETDHHGLFECQVTNTEGTTLKHIIVDVYYGPETVNLTRKNTTVREYRTFTISCRADCRPVCDFSWQNVNGDQVSSSDQLRFSTIDRKYAGKYFCQARNKYGSEDSAKVSITVFTMPTKVGNMSVICTGPDSAAISWIPDLSVVPEQNFTVLFWAKGSDSKSNKVYFRDTNQPFIYILHLNKLSPSTKYYFQIVSENSIGKAWSNLRTCSTLEPPSIKSMSSIVLFSGIAMLSVASLITVIFIIPFLLRKYKICKIWKKDDKCGSCLSNIQLPCRKTKRESNYVNTSLPLSNGEQDEFGEHRDLYENLEVTDKTKVTQYSKIRGNDEQSYVNLTVFRDTTKTKIEYHQKNKKEDFEKIQRKPPVKQDGKQKLHPKPNMKC